MKGEHGFEALKTIYKLFTKVQNNDLLVYKEDKKVNSMRKL